VDVGIKGDVLTGFVAPLLGTDSRLLQITIRVEFKGLPVGITSGEVLFESPRTVEAKAGSFKDWFAPFDVHVFRFTAH
jgi:hypothetical protein